MYIYLYMCFGIYYNWNNSFASHFIRFIFEFRTTVTRRNERQNDGAEMGGDRVLTNRGHMDRGILVGQKNK